MNQKKPTFLSRCECVGLLASAARNLIEAVAIARFRSWRSVESDRPDKNPRRLDLRVGLDNRPKMLEDMMPLSEFNGIAWTIFQSAKVRMTGQLGCCGYILLQLRR